MDQNVFVVKDGDTFRGVYLSEMGAFREATRIILSENLHQLDFVEQDHDEHLQDCGCTCHDDGAADDHECDDYDCSVTMSTEDFEEFKEELRFMVQREQFKEAVQKWNGLFDLHFSEYSWDFEDRGSPQVYVEEVPLKK